MDLWERYAWKHKREQEIKKMSKKKLREKLLVAEDNLKWEKEAVDREKAWVKRLEGITDRQRTRIETKDKELLQKKNVICHLEEEHRNTLSAIENVIKYRNAPLDKPIDKFRTEWLIDELRHRGYQCHMKKHEC